MQRLNKSITHAVDRPVKVMQFGEGNFLRAFVDYIFDVTNEKTDFNGDFCMYWNYNNLSRIIRYFII